VNPLSQLTHERRLSALGPGASTGNAHGFDVRDVHTSHYGRICPIETPEGTNIGLIVSLGVFAGVDEYGFLATPYRRVEKGKLASRHNENGQNVPDIRYLRADEEDTVCIAPADTPMDKQGRITGRACSWRRGGDFVYVPKDDVTFIDISPKQMVGVSARPDPVPRAQRREPRAHGLEHAAPGCAAADHRGAARRHGHGEAGRPQLGMVVVAEEDGV